MLYAMMATTLAGLATALGGALGALYRPGRQGMAFSMGFGAGIMVAISLMDMLPAALGRYLAAFCPLRAGAMAASLVLLGLAAGWLLERVLPEETALAGEEGRVLRSALITALALVGHNLPEGVMTLFASLEDPEVGTRLAVAIGLHNLPEGRAAGVVCHGQPGPGLPGGTGLGAGGACGRAAGLRGAGRTYHSGPCHRHGGAGERRDVLGEHGAASAHRIVPGQKGDCGGRLRRGPFGDDPWNRTAFVI